MRSNKQSECIKSSIKLKQQEEVIQKTLDNFVDSMKLEPELLRGLQQERHSYSLDRRKLSNSLRASVLEITNYLKAIKSTISSFQEGYKIDVDSFKGKLISLADKIREFKKKCSIEDLSSEEMELDQYLHEFSLTLTKYDIRNTSASSVIGPRESSKTKDNNFGGFQDYIDARNFDALIAKTGHTQNWSEEDHLFFLKVRKMSQNVPAMVAGIRKKCPDLSVERIVNHEAWYKIYLDLREKQRKTIKEWRTKKDLKKLLKVENTEDTRNERNVSDTHGTKPDHENETKKVVENTSRNTVKFSGPRDSSTNDKKEILNRWRTEKENERALEDEQRKSESESRRVWKENRRLARAKRIKAAVTAYKEKKMENVLPSSTACISDSDRMVGKSETVKLIKSYRRQDEEFLARRKALLASKKQNPSFPHRRKVQTRYDGNSTLQKPTKVWLEKCKHEEGSHLELPRQILYVKDIPKLASCSWRNREFAGKCQPT